MKKNYLKDSLLLVCGILLSMLFVTSCKKDNGTPVVKAVPLATIGLYELVSGTNRRAFIHIGKVGTQTLTNVYGVFDTGSPGMTLDADNVIPASMITSNGIVVAGDSVNVNGITVTSQQAVITYGDNGGQTKEYGNLAYATVTIGDQNGIITTPRIPFFLYYKIVDVTTGNTLPTHSNDVFGVGPGISFANNAIKSPLSYFKYGTNVTNGFKLAVLPDASFTTNGSLVSGLLTIGLVPGDLSSASGFVLHPLRYFAQGGYSPDLPATISYNGTTVAATVLFDTGTPSISTIENSAASSPTSTLPPGTTVNITTQSGFSYQYTTTSNYNLTQVDRPSFSGDPRTIFGIDFFVSNEFLTDYQNHQIGLKNN